MFGQIGSAVGLILSLAFAAEAKTTTWSGGAGLCSGREPACLASSVRTALVGRVGEAVERCLESRVYSEWANGPMYEEAVHAFRTHADDKRNGWQNEYWGKTMLCFAGAIGYTGDPALKARTLAKAHSFVDEFQRENGYLSTYAQEDSLGDPTSGPGWCFNVWGRKYTIWGMLLAYGLTRDREILSSVERQMDQWIGMMHKLTRPLWKTGEPTYVGLPSMSVLKPLMCLYRETGKASYLDYAREMLPDWERDDGAPPNLIKNAFRADPIHAWYPKPDGWAKAYEMMSCLDGLLEYYRVTGEKRYLDAVVAIARNIRDTERNQVGAVGYNDHFSDALHRPNAVSEPCDVVHWIRLNHDIYLITGDKSYVDEIEISFYNALLGAMTRDGAWGARCVRSHGRNWHDSTGQCELKYQHCCVNNLPRGLMDVAQTFVTADREGNLQVNLYSDVDVTIAGAKVSIRGNFPVDSKVTVTVVGLKPDQKVDFRKPSWCPKMGNQTIEKSNNQTVYELTFDMNPRVIDWDMPPVLDHDLKQERGYDRRVAQFTDYYRERDMVPLVRSHPAATVMYGPLILAKSKLVGATREQVFDLFTANMKGYRASVERIPSDKVWGAWTVTLEKGDDRHVYPTADLGSACDRVTPRSTDEYSIWF